MVISSPLPAKVLDRSKFYRSHHFRLGKCPSLRRGWGRKPSPAIADLEWPKAITLVLTPYCADWQFCPRC